MRTRSSWHNGLAPRASAVLAIILAIGSPAAAESPFPGDAASPVASADADPDAAWLFDPAVDEGLGIEVAPDPLEGINRTFFSFNGWLDAHFWRPVSRAYRFVVPEPGRDAVQRVFLNLNAPPVFVNDLLQLRFLEAGETLGRFALNSTLGIGGLFDAGIEAGWEPHQSDFGQTLAVYGVPPGPFLVAPVFGPSTIRDGFGRVVDRFFDPLTYAFGIGVFGSTLISSSIQLSIGTGSGIATYDAHADDLAQLQAASLDFYSVLRSAYLQSRSAEIRAIQRD